MSIETSSSPLGAGTVPPVRPASEARTTAVAVSDHFLTVHLDDGRMLSVPASWFSRLARATAAQRAHYELVDGGRAIHWPEIEEDISVAGLLGGTD
jgi:hypothetical protein